MIQVLVDFSYLAYRAFYGLRGLAHDEAATGVLFGFFQELKNICFDPRILSNQVHLFLDSRQSYRRRDFPQYKASRRENKTQEEQQQANELHRQMNLLIDEILPACGFSLYRQTGCESDDLIAKALRYGIPSVMVTADSDLYQCITNYASWFDPARNLWIDPQSFFEKKGTFPFNWIIVKCLSGCSTDGVPGIPGVGEKTAIDFILKKLPHHHKRYRAICSPAGRAVANRNQKLIDLPHPKTKPIFLQPPQYNTDAFFAFCENYGIDSYLDGSKRKEWVAFFAGEMIKPRQQTRRQGEKR